MPRAIMRLDSWPVFWPVRILRRLEAAKEPAVLRALLACCARMKAALSSDQAGAALDPASESNGVVCPLAVEQCGGRAAASYSISLVYRPTHRPFTAYASHGRR